MNQERGGGPAFPSVTQVRRHTGKTRSTNALAATETFEIRDEWMPGMTLRDYFASQAIGFVTIKDGSVFDVEKLARWAYQLADAMLEERSKP